MKDTVDPEVFEQLAALSEKYDATENKGDSAGMAALFTDDAIVVTDNSPLKGRQAIEKWNSDTFQAFLKITHVAKPDEDGSHMIGTADDQAWVSGAWNAIFQGATGDPVQLKGFWSAIEVRKGDEWKFRTLTWNITPAAAPSSKITE